MYDTLRKLLKRNDDFIPLPVGYDPKVFNSIMARAITSEQQNKLLRTAYHLTQLWNSDKTAHIPQVIVMVEANYPHLERMADLEIFGNEWLAELATVMQYTSGSANNLVGQSEQFKQLLSEAYENVKAD